MAEFESCFIYKPQDSIDHTSSGRPNKRRKTSTVPSEPTQCNAALFLPLFAGKEELRLAQLRYESFQSAWNPLERSLNKLSIEHYASTINNIACFVEEAETKPNPIKLPTGLIVGAPNVSSQVGLTEAIAGRIGTHEDALIISLPSTQSPNLKAALKYINREATSQAQNDDVKDVAQSSRCLNYDLQILHDHVQARSIRKVVLYFQDSEGYQDALLSDLIDIFSSWADRIPFVLLFGIATSVDLFQEKLSQATLRLLEGTQFEVNQLDVEVLLKVITNPDRPSKLWLGAGLCRSMIQRHRDHVQTANDFVHTIKYLYMSYFFSDPLSVLPNILEDSDVLKPTLQHEHLEAVRTLSSYKRYAGKLLDDGDVELVRSLLDEDEVLLDAIKTATKENQDFMHGIVAGMESIEIIQSHLSLKKPATWSDLYIKAMSGELSDSTLLREILLSVKKLSSDGMQTMTNSLSDHLPALESIHKDLSKLISATTNKTAPLRSEHSIYHSTLRTTVVAQKVELSKQTAALSAQDIAYSQLVNRVDAALREYFEQTFINPQDLLLHEVFIYDAKSPYRDVFTPRPRFAVERALSSPHDYLGCTCCESGGNGLSSTQPATAVLYQLYLESGSQINVADLWSAFNTIVGAEAPEDAEADQQKTLALFSQALAELKYLGMIKSSRKKADHLTKLTWKGL